MHGHEDQSMYYKDFARTYSKFVNNHHYELNVLHNDHYTTSKMSREIIYNIKALNKNNLFTKLCIIIGNCSRTCANDVHV